MSRIGKKPIPITQGVTVSVAGSTVKVRGPKGELQTALGDLVGVKVENNQVVVEPRDDSKPARAAWGMSRTMVNNMVQGFTHGFNRTL